MKIRVAIAAGLVAALSLSATLPAFAADAPGKCGTGKYFDKKTKKCASK